MVETGSKEHIMAGEMLGMVETGSKEQIMAGEMLGMVELGCKEQIMAGEMLLGWSRWAARKRFFPVSC